MVDPERKRRQCTDAQAGRYSDPALVLAGWKPAVPPLASILSQVPAGTRSLPRPALPAAARVARAGTFRILEILKAGPNLVREVRPDGTSRVLFRCMAPCVEPLEATPRSPVWMEVLRAKVLAGD